MRNSEKEKYLSLGCNLMLLRVVWLGLVLSREYAFGWVRLCKFRVITIYPVTALAAVALVSNSLESAVWPILSILFTSIGIYMANDVFDLPEDRINSPERPLPRGLIGLDTVKVAASAFIVAGVGLTAMKVEALPFVGLLAVVGLAYSIPPLRLKRFTLVPYLVVGVFGFSNFMTGASWVAKVDGRMVLVGLIMFAVYLGSCQIKEFKDVSGDMEKGHKTLPVLMGVETGAKVSVAIILSANFLLLAPYFLYDLSLLYPIGFAVLCVLLWLNAFSFLKNPTENQRARRYLLNSIMIGIGQYAVLIISALTS